MERSSQVLQHKDPKLYIFYFKKIQNWQNWILSIPREKKSLSLHQYQSYISNWYNNGNVFMRSYYIMETQKFDFFCQEVRNWILSILWMSITQKINHPGFVNISPTLVIDTSMERSSWVLQHGNPTTWFFFKNVQNWILTCGEELKSTFK